MKTTILFDFGGVMAEEGFREGLKAIARTHDLDQEAFFVIARDTIYETGYVTGTSDERTYWQTVRNRCDISGSDEELRTEILSRFILRPQMFDEVAALRIKGHVVALLTDQTDWLGLLDRRHGMKIASSFDFVFNSYDLHMSKRDHHIFSYVEQTLQTDPTDLLFVDDSTANVQTAATSGWQTILFLDFPGFKKQLHRLLKSN